METHLHLGAHRTGTTAAQKLLQSRSAMLRPAGLAYLGPLELRGWGMFDVIQRMVDGRAQEDQVDGVREILAEADTGAGPRTRIVISDENLAGSLLQNHATATLYQEADARLGALAGLLPKAPDLVCFTIRDLVGYWQSAFAHLSMRGRVERFEPWRLAQSPNSSWLPVLQAVRSAFPNALLKVFGYDENVVPRLTAALVGPDLAARLPVPRRTYGLALPGAVATPLAGLPANPERDLVSLRLRQTRDTPERSFSVDEARFLKDAYAADWLALRNGAVAGAHLDPGETEDFAR